MTRRPMSPLVAAMLALVPGAFGPRPRRPAVDTKLTPDAEGRVVLADGPDVDLRREVMATPVPYPQRPAPPPPLPRGPLLPRPPRYVATSTPVKAKPWKLVVGVDLGKDQAQAATTPAPPAEPPRPRPPKASAAARRRRRGW